MNTTDLRVKQAENIEKLISEHLWAVAMYRIRVAETSSALALVREIEQTIESLGGTVETLEENN